MSSRSLVAALAAFAAASVAAGAQTPPNPPTASDSAAPVAASAVVDPKAADTSRVAIDFQNQSWLLATVYATRESGQTARIGQVGAGRQVRLYIPRAMVSGSEAIHIVAIPFGHRTGTSSDVFAVVPGDRLVATLEPGMRTLSVIAPD